ncbi:MAG: DNA-protecting protein DprA [Gammaproteobacteria bacterium]|nr:DNA-protecting protein DprA [Gammaproteobacteria bacterium]
MATAMTDDQITADWLAKPQHHLLTRDDPRYPPLLLDTPNPPEQLFVAGDPDVLSLPQLAIVGSRNATGSGLDAARQFARHLAGCGLTITSGLALGVDAAAHEGALEGKGLTIGVLGHGPDEIYPQRNAALAQRICLEGALVSEFAPGTPVRRNQFPQRNRIIAGLSVGTLVVEAGMNSGSLITAGFAGDYGREVFAIPGSIHNPLAKGCHRLIRQGAKLVEQAADIIEEIGHIARSMTPESRPDTDLHTHADSAAFNPALSEHGPADPDHRILLDHMGYDPVSVDGLVSRSGLTAEELSSMLLILELQGKVEALPGGRFQQTTWNQTHE